MLVRVCSFLPSATEILFALGLGESVVGVSHECNYPPEARQKPTVVHSSLDPQGLSSKQIHETVGKNLQSNRSLYSIDLIRLREAEPDLILTQELCGVCALDYATVAQAVGSMARMPEILSLAPRTLSDVLRDIALVGQATEKIHAAATLVSQLEERIDHVRSLGLSAGSQPKVACIEWMEPFYSAGHWVPEMVNIAGGKDELGFTAEPSRKITWDEMLAYAPEVIVLMPCGFNVEQTLREAERIRDLPGWNQLPAVGADRVFAVDGNAYFSRSGPRLVDGLEILAQIVHPEIFSWEASPDSAVTIGPSIHKYSLRT